MENLLVEPTPEMEMQQAAAEQARSNHVDAEMDWRVRMFYEDDEEYGQEVRTGREKYLLISLSITCLFCMTQLFTRNNQKADIDV